MPNSLDMFRAQREAADSQPTAALGLCEPGSSGSGRAGARNNRHLSTG